MISAFFTADYRDGRVIFGGKSYPAGVFATHLLGQFYINDTAARIAVFRDDLNYHILKQLNDGYLNVTEFVKTGANTLIYLYTFLDNTRNDRCTNFLCCLNHRLKGSCQQDFLI